MDKKDKILATILLISVISNAILIVKDSKKNNNENTKVVEEVEDKFFYINNLIVINRSNKYFILKFNFNKNFSKVSTEINGLFTSSDLSDYPRDFENVNGRYTELIDMLTIDEIQLANNQGGYLSLEQLNNICLRINEKMSLQQEEGKSLKLD